LKLVLLLPFQNGNLSWLRECLDNQVGVNGLDKAGSTALYWACHGGHKDTVEMLFTQPNIELNQQNKLGDTALHAAAWKGYADIVQLLLAKVARTDLRNNEKKLALDMATNAACASLLKKKQGTDAVRTLSNAEDYLDDEESD
ncbi:osteoclast-stimulating factor 1-like, partial [Physeter macrocephalus]|uniref:Osteoclast-stimulating factor 1-like n=1 Tax=Physeter macrocephalus TaxID=9755 RepID=A0A9W2WV77_PHYMC